MLKTPLGSIELFIDNTIISYEAIKIKNDKTCLELDGRYFIKVKFIPDGKIHEIKCCIKDYIKSTIDEIETGENLELKNFYYRSIKLSIGMEGDTGYFSNGSRDSLYDYDIEYLNNGVKYIILPNTKTNEYVFGIAWLEHSNKNNELQTWFGADPTIFHLLK